MEIELQGKGALVVRAYKGTPFYEAKWRNAAAKQFKRRLGRAWLEPDPEGGWRKRRGRVRDGFLDERGAYREMSRLIAEVEAEQQIAPSKREARFEMPSTFGSSTSNSRNEPSPPRSPGTGACSPSPSRDTANAMARAS